MSKSSKVSELSIEGRFLGFLVEDGEVATDELTLPKRLRLATAEGEHCIKLAKELRTDFDLRLTPGDWVQVTGERKLDRKSGKLKLKAKTVTPVASSQLEIVLPAKAIPNKTKANILVCQKSDCLKRGGKAVCQALAAALRDRGLEDEVAIKLTGCMKKCSSGPNLVMPDKTRHSRVKAARVPELLDSLELVK